MFFIERRLASIAAMGLLIALAGMANAQSASNDQSSPQDKTSTKQAGGDNGASADKQANALAKAVNLQAQFFGNATHPQFGSPWSMRLQLAFLYPKLSKAEQKEILEKKLKQLEQEQQSPKK